VFIAVKWIKYCDYESGDLT